MRKMIMQEKIKGIQKTSFLDFPDSGHFTGYDCILLLRKPPDILQYTDVSECLPVYRYDSYFPEHESALDHESL